MAENTVTSKDTPRQMENNCLRCVKWNDGKGLEVLYQAGIEPVTTRLESMMRFSNDATEIRGISYILAYLQQMDEAIVGFQVELGLIKDDEEEKNEEA